MGKQDSRRPKRDRLSQEKNRIRGLIAITKSSAVKIDGGRGRRSDKVDRARQFQRSLVAALIKSRESLATGQFDDFLRWMESQTQTQLSSLASVGPLPADLVREVVGAQALPLQKEILWVVSRLSSHKAALDRFAIDSARLEQLYWSGTWPQILEQLNSIESTHGRSLWVTEARIALTQEFEGLEAQKLVVATERRAGARSLSAYVAYQIGVRNEPTSDLTRFKRDVLAKLDQLSVSESLKDFLRLRVANEPPRTERAAAGVLQIAQSLSEIDLFDTLLEVCRTPIAKLVNDSHQGAIFKALERLSSVGSAELDDTIGRLKGSNPHLQAGLAIAISGSIRTNLRQLEHSPQNYLLAIRLASRLNLERVESHVVGARRQWSAMIRLMSSILKFDDGYDALLQEFHKHLANRRVFRTAGLLHTSFASSAHALDGLNAFYDPDSAPLHTELEGRLRWPMIIRELGKLRQAIDLADYNSIVTQICSLRIDQRAPLSAIPLKDALADVKWRQIKGLRSSISLAIALHLCWRATDSDLAATNLRFAYEEFLDSHSLDSPADLVKSPEKFPKSQVIYFLREVCVPSVMDMSQRIESSRGVSDARLSVCAALRELDAANADVYQAEIVSIVHSQTILDGQTLVDSSRVHVDTGAIRAWAARVLETEMQRYSALVRAGIGTAEDIDTILRNTKSNNILPYLEVPEGEADEILVEMMVGLQKQFLLDPQHGLDSYLSRRVRHHSMTGYIRGPVEEKKLITSRNTKSGRYAENTAWLNDLKLSGLVRQSVSRALTQFSEDFDKVLLALKNNLFHVRSVEHPYGLFDIPLIPPMVHLGRSAVQVDLGIDQLCSVCFSMFWAGLEPSLKEAQRHLRQDAKRDVLAVFQRLRANLRKDLEAHPGYSEISIAIGHASESVQREIDKMAEWFVRKEVQQTKHLYSLDKVLEISISSALASHRPFSHPLTRSVDCDFYVRTGDLVVIAEIVLTALGNIRAHSGGPDTRVSVSISCAQQDRISLRIENDVFPEASQQAKDRVEEIRQEILSGTYIEKIRGEGGTGLMKIAATAAQSKLGQLEFGFLSESRFFVEVTLAFIRESAIESLEVSGRLVG